MLELGNIAVRSGTSQIVKGWAIQVSGDLSKMKKDHGSDGYGGNVEDGLGMTTIDTPSPI